MAQNACGNGNADTVTDEDRKKAEELKEKANEFFKSKNELNILIKLK